MGADQHLVITFKERDDAVDLAAILAGCVAQVPFRGNGPVGPEAELGQRLVGKAGTDAFFRHDDDGLANALVRQLIERDEHEGAALARRRGRLDKKILLAALLIGAFLHRSNAAGVGFIGVTVGSIRNRVGRTCYSEQSGVGTGVGSNVSTAYAS